MDKEPPREGVLVKSSFFFSFGGGWWEVGEEGRWEGGRKEGRG